MAAIAAERVVRHLERADFVVITAAERRPRGNKAGFDG
jgi:hypothetical protein